ncbi:AEC family transporter [Desulfocurvus sp. DL9XJH121]
MISAIVPVFAVILLGYALSRFHFPGDAFWPLAERITYYVLFPALLVSKLAPADLGGGAPALAMATFCAALVLGGILLALRRRLGFDGPAFSSVFQGSVRMNTYIGLAGAAALYGDLGITLSAVVILGTVILNNLMCVTVVARHGAARNGHGAGLLMEVLRNPLILGCGAGLALNASALPLPGVFFETLDVLSRAALPMGLLAVGAGLRFSHMGSDARGIAAAIVCGLIVFPLLAAGSCMLFGVHGEARAVAVLFAALPTASSSFILARQLGGDTELMASIITVQTMASALTIPTAMALLA